MVGALTQSYIKSGGSKIWLHKTLRTISNSSLNKNAKLSDINSIKQHNIDQIWELKKLRVKNPNNDIKGNLNITIQNISSILTK